MRILLFICFFLLPSLASAHQTGASTFVVNVHDDGIVETLIALPVADVAHGLDVDTDRNGAIAPNELAPRYGDIADYLDKNIQLANGESVCEVTEKKSAPLGQALTSYFFLKTFRCPLPLTVLTFTNTALLDSPDGYRHLGRIQYGEKVETTAFNKEFPTYTLKIAEPESNLLDVFTRYLVEGVGHILLGPDHVLFVLLLMLIAVGFRQLIWVVSSFTIAHSITLGLAALNVADVPASVVEPAIALSIAYVAVETLIRKQPPKYLIIATFMFGLVHGFGFSYVLRDEVGLPTAALVPALAAFNVGVELGQLSILLPLYPLRRWLVGKPYERRVTQVLATAALAVALYWLIERTLGFHV